MRSSQWSDALVGRRYNLVLIADLSKSGMPASGPDPYVLFLWRAVAMGSWGWDDSLGA